MTNRRYRLRLTERDRVLFNYLFITKGATRLQIHRDIFVDLSRVIVHRRLEKLYKHRYIKKFPTFFEGAKTAYHLEPKGLSYCDFSGVEPQRVQLKSSCPDHDFSLIEIRNVIFRAEGLVHYLTENQLQSGLLGSYSFNYGPFIDRFSDAFLRIKLGRGEFSGAIEFEKSIKSNDRYIDLFLRYYMSKKIEFVLYVVCSPQLIPMIWSIDNQVRRQKRSKIFTVTYDDLKFSKDFVSFRSSERLILTINLSAKMEVVKTI